MSETAMRTAEPHEIGDLTRDVRHYLSTSGWSERPPGPAGSLWFQDQPDQARGERALAVPVRIEPDTSEWKGVLHRLAAFEQRPLHDVYLSITTQFVDVTRFRASDYDQIKGSIPLAAGARLAEAAYSMLRAAATTSQSPRSHIGGNFSKPGEVLAAKARMAHTEEGSYVLPIWMPLTPPEHPDQAASELGLEFHRASEPPERRVTRTLAQAMTALDEVIVRPEREPTPADLAPLVMAGVSRELVSAVHRVVGGSLVNSLEAGFTWASALHSPDAIDRVFIGSEVADRLKRAADALRRTRRHPSEVITGPIVEIRRVPGDPFGEVSIDTVRRGRASEVRVRLNREDLNKSFTWAQTERTLLVEGSIETTHGGRLLIASPRRYLPLDETFLPAGD